MSAQQSAAMIRIVDKLREHGCAVTESGSSSKAQCPAHDDRNPSLSISERGDHRGVLIHCHAGCDYRAILDAIGLRDGDLFDDPLVTNSLNPNASYSYGTGSVKVRTTRADGSKTFFWEGDDPKSLYAVDHLGDAQVVYLCEGEKGVDFLRALGHPAVATGGSQRLKIDFAPLAGRHILMIVDRDEAGHAWARKCEAVLAPIAASISAMQSKVDIPKADIVEHIAGGYELSELVPFIQRPDEPVFDEPEPAPRNPASHLEEIERGFWDSRESLRMVWQTSMAKMCPPWAVLGICAARALAQVRPHVTLPALIGGPGSLNWFAAIVAGPAGGKTTSGSAAELLVPGHLVTCLQGTGEGILATFGRTSEQGDADQPPENECIFLDVDEIDSLGAVAGRSGSTTMPLLRSAFSGATLGFSYAARDKRRFIRKHSYRMTAVIGIQPQRAGWLLGDAAGGTPQRLMWFPATDSRIKMERPWESGPLALPSPGEWQYPREIRIPKEAEHVLLSEHVKRQQGGQDALDGHALFCREKFAYALAVLDGRVEMNLEDWELSGIAADVSIYTREMVVDELKSAAQLEAADRGELRGIEIDSADITRLNQQAQRRQRVLKWLLHKLDAAGDAGISQSDLLHRISGKDRPELRHYFEVGNELIYKTQSGTATIWHRA